MLDLEKKIRAVVWVLLFLLGRKTEEARKGPARGQEDQVEARLIWAPDSTGRPLPTLTA